MDYTGINANVIDSWIEKGWKWGIPISHEQFVDALKHPLMEAATMLLPDEDALSINRRLIDNSDSDSDMKF